MYEYRDVLAYICTKCSYRVDVGFQANKNYVIVSKVYFVYSIWCVYVNCGKRVIVGSQVSNNKNQSIDWS